MFFATVHTPPAAMLQRGWCVTFAASEIVVSEGERDAEDYVLLNVSKADEYSMKIMTSVKS